MTDRDITPAERVQAFADMWSLESGTRPNAVLAGIEDGAGRKRKLRLDDLHAVLAEHRQMREAIDGLKVAWESRYSDGEYPTKDHALRRATADNFREATDDAIVWRLVGPWHDGSEPVPEGWQPAGDVP